MRRAAASLTLIALSALAPALAQAAQFEDRSAASGLSGTHTESWGIAIGDLNGDRYPDIMSPNHRNRANLYRNNGDGTFSEVSAEVDLSGTDGWTGPVATRDHHSAAWADYDNDGDQDLTMLISRVTDPFFINDGGLLSDAQGSIWSGSVPHDRDRQALFFDYTGDGKLDMFIVALLESGLYEQKPDGTFGGAANIDSVGCSNVQATFAHLVDVHPSPGLELVCGPHNGAYPASVTAFNGGTPFDVSGVIPTRNRVADVGTGDFDRNGYPDIVEVISSQRFSDAVQVNDLRVEAQFLQGGGTTKVMTFETDGTLTVTVETSRGDCSSAGCPSAIEIGSGAYNPAALTFVLDPTDPANHGNPPDSLDINIGFDPATSEWRVQSAGNPHKYTFVGIESTSTISNLDFVGSGQADTPDLPVLLMNNGDGTWSDDSQSSGLDPVMCSSVGVGDVDNDMDEDLYFGCTGGARNAPNLLYLNNGDGTFQLAPEAAGAAGFDGPAYADGNGEGTTETVALADFDLDGFLDIFVANGNNMRPQDYGGPNQFFRNLGNGNHWLQLDLAGVSSNRDGIGAIVRVTAGGITQYREVNGGYHRWSQNLKRLHVGLGGNVSATVEITWPSGIVDVHQNVAADVLYEAVEGGAIAPASGEPDPDSDGDGLSDAQEAALGTDPNDPDTDGGSVNDGDEVANGTDPLDPSDDVAPPQPDFCGDPDYDNQTDRGTFLWQDCDGSGLWHLHVSGGGTPSLIIFTGNIESDGGVSAFTPYQLEGNDVIDQSVPDVLSYQLRIYNNGVDGFEFLTAPNACFTPESPGGLPVYLGQGRTPLATANMDMTTGAACEPPSGGGGLTPADFCGDPDVTNSVDRGTFLWQDCGSGRWHLRTSGGGTPSGIFYEGSVAVTGGVANLTPVSVEGNDVLDTSTDPDALTYLLRIWNNGLDGFDFDAGANACFTHLGPDLPVLVGAGRIELEDASVDLTTAGACN